MSYGEEQRYNLTDHVPSLLRIPAGADARVSPAPLFLRQNGIFEIKDVLNGSSATRRIRRVASFRLIAQSVPILRLRDLDGLLLNIARIVSAAALQRYHMVHDRSGNLMILGGIWEDHLGERACFRSRWSPHQFRPEHLCRRR